MSNDETVWFDSFRQRMKLFRATALETTRIKETASISAWHRNG
jgi:hypothetical protein